MAAEFAVVILAAGKGTRLKSAQAKVLHRAGGRTLIEHVVRACQPLGAAEICVVIGHQAEEVRAAVAPLSVKTVLQEPQRGTGHAVAVAREALGKKVKYAIVLPGDAPLVRTETLRFLLESHLISGPAATILTAILDDPTGYGRIVRREDGGVSAIVEEKALDREQRKIREINSSIYCFTLEKLWPCLEKLKPDNVHKELYLTDAIALLHQRRERVEGIQAADPREILGCNTRADLAEVDRIFRERKRAALLAAGVTLQLPETILIDPEVEAGPDTILEPGVQLLGATRLGARCTVRTGSVISDSVLDDDVTVRPHCVVANTRVGAGCVIGPFAHLRDGAELKPGARVGNYVEVKKSTLAEGVKAMHLTYLGDATVGRDTNVGAGTITCNYDGVRKNPTKIGARVFVGSGTELVAPVEVGDDAYIAAGSTITENVPSGALAIARERQVVKEGWVEARRTNAPKSETRNSKLESGKAKSISRAPRAGRRAGGGRSPKKRR
jgi:bifunctional UDP-N-acetylglucosamine pyrophosphorylase/glucosamine-1-phosphate N-acetyltransferase